MFNRTVRVLLVHVCKGLDLFLLQVFNGTKDPYTNPPAPVHIVTGSAGCNERTDPFVPNPPPWSAFRSSEYGQLKWFAILLTLVSFSFSLF